MRLATNAPGRFARQGLGSQAANAGAAIGGAVTASIGGIDEIAGQLTGTNTGVALTATYLTRAISGITATLLSLKSPLSAFASGLGVATIGIGAFAFAIASAIRSVSETANALRSIRNQTGIGYGQGYGLVARSSALGIGPQALAGMLQGSQMNPLLFGVRASAQGLPNYTDPRFYERLASRYQATANTGPTGRLVANQQLNSLYGGQAPAEILNIANLPVSKIRGNLNYSQQVQKNLGINGESLRAYSEDLPLLQNRIGSLVDGLKVKFAVALIPLLERLLTVISRGLGNNSQQIGDVVQKVAEWLVVKLPAQIMHGVARIVQAFGLLQAGIGELVLGIVTLVNSLKTALGSISKLNPFNPQNPISPANPHNPLNPSNWLPTWANPTTWFGSNAGNAPGAGSPITSTQVATARAANGLPPVHHSATHHAAAAQHHATQAAAHAQAAQHAASQPVPNPSPVPMVATPFGGNLMAGAIAAAGGVPASTTPLTMAQRRARAGMVLPHPVPLPLAAGAALASGQIAVPGGAGMAGSAAAGGGMSATLAGGQVAAGGAGASGGLGMAALPYIAIPAAVITAGLGAHYLWTTHNLDQTYGTQQRAVAAQQAQVARMAPGHARAAFLRGQSSGPLNMAGGQQFTAPAPPPQMVAQHIHQGGNAFTRGVQQFQQVASNPRLGYNAQGQTVDLNGNVLTGGLASVARFGYDRMGSGSGLLNLSASIDKTADKYEKEMLKEIRDNTKRQADASERSNSGMFALAAAMSISRQRAYEAEDFGGALLSRGGYTEFGR